MTAIFSLPPSSCSLVEKARKRTGRANFNQLAPPCWEKVIQQNQGKFRCLFLAVVQVVYAPTHLWEGGARCFVQGSFGTLRRYSRLKRYCWTEDFNTTFQEKDKRFSTPHVITVDRYYLEARMTTGLGGGTRVWKFRGMNGRQGTPRSEELGGKYDLKSRGSAFSFTPSQQQETTHQLPKHLQM